MKTYFVTGITGFVGRNLTMELLKKKDIHIIGLVLPEDKSTTFYEQYENITLVRGDLRNRSDVERFLSTPYEGEKIVLHNAGYISVYLKNDKYCMDTNANGTKNMVDICLEKGDVTKFVYTSSVDAIKKGYDTADVFEPESFTPDLLKGVYSKSKAIASNYVLEGCKKGLNACMVMPSAILGPNDPFEAPINASMKKFLKKKLPAIVKGGYDMVDVRDVANAILSAEEKGKKGEYYLVTGTHISIKDFIGEIAKIENMKPIATQIPHILIKMVSPFIELHSRIHHKKPLFTGFAMDCLLQNSHYNHQKATIEINYHPRSLTETLNDTIEWMKETDYLSR